MTKWNRETIKRLIPEDLVQRSVFQCLSDTETHPGRVTDALLQTRLDLEIEKGNYQTALTEWAESRKEISRLRGALERAQWGGRTASQSWLACPECGAYPPSPHERIMVGNGIHQPDCNIGQALKGVQDEKPSE